MKTVFRIEDRNDRGPYYDYESTGQIISHEVTKKHPLINQELPDVATWDDTKRYCFASLKQLYTWFTRQELVKLFNIGYELHAYEVKEEGLMVSPTQALFSVDSVIS